METRRGALALPLAFLLLFTAAGESRAGACFADKTSSINITLPGGTSTGLATFDFNDDSFLDLQVAYDEDETVFYEGDEVSSGFPRWTDSTASVYPSYTQPDEEATEPIPADYDNDGDIDLYVFSDNDGGNLLYRNNGNGTFTEVGSSLGIRGTGIYGGEVAAWGDYDGDGWMDLVMDGTYRQLLRNAGASGTVSFSLTSSVLPDSTYVQVAEDFVWIDLDHDGDLDIFELNGDSSGSGASDVLLSSGGSSPTFTLTTATQWQALRSLYGRSVAMAQIIDDQGGYAEIFTSSDIQSDLVKTTSSGASWVRSLPTRGGDAFVLDFNLDGSQDLFLYDYDQSGSSADEAVLLRNDGGTTFTDVSTSAQLDAEGIAHGVAADFDGDGDVDLFQADGDGDTRLFMENFDTRVCTSCGAGEDDPYNGYITVRLQGHAVGTYHVDETTNTDLIGTYLMVEETGAGQFVQGHKSTSTPPSVPIVFGTGQESELILHVTWPNGVESEFEELEAGEVITLQDQSVPYVKLNSVSGSKTLGPGTVDFVFEWDTVGPSSSDEIVLTLNSGSPGGNCYNYVTTIYSGDGDVTKTVTQTGLNNYHHELTWEGQDCYTDCKIDFVVYSKNSVAESWSDAETVAIKSCVGGV